MAEHDESINNQNITNDINTLSLAELWKKILEDFQNEELHDRYIQLCWQSGDFLDAISNYKSRIDEFPDDQIAAKYMNQLNILTQYSLLTHKDDEKQQTESSYSKDLKTIIFTVFTLIVTGVAINQGWLTRLFSGFKPIYVNLIGSAIFIVLIVIILAKVSDIIKNRFD